MLAEQRFIATAGGRDSIADITARVDVAFGRVVELRPIPEQRKVLRRHADVSARPSGRP